MRGRGGVRSVADGDVTCHPLGHAFGGRSYSIFLSLMRTEKKVPVRSHPSAPVHRPHPIPARSIRDGGVESKNLGTDRNVPWVVMRRTSATPTSGRCAARSALAEEK